MVGGDQNPKVGATFYPGGVDDFYMPELVSPAPQRVMPEVPEQIQENLAHLELEANSSKPRPQRIDTAQRTPLSPPASMTSYQFNHNNKTSHPQGTATTAYPRQTTPTSAYPPTPAVSQPSTRGAYNGGADTQGQAYRDILPMSQGDYEPTPFSPFPALHNPPPNVPMNDDQKEATLEQARVAVLNSNDPEMQLAWAQDALAYVEVAIQHELRISEHEHARPHTPQVEHQIRVDAMNIVSFLADQHHPKAEFMKGMWLEFGKFGYRVDKKEAFRCYTRAAEKGYARAEYRIGMQYETSNDSVRAVKHYQTGTQLGDSASTYRLGMMILLGQHDQKQDYAYGIQLVKQAALTADENAPQGAYVYGMLLAKALPQVNIPDTYLPEDIIGARENIEKAAYLGFAKAQLKMGAAYELSQLGCDFDPTLSLHYNALAARQGEPEADLAISKWFLCGHEPMFSKNEEMAYTYAQRAAFGGLATAEFAMGYYNEIGIYVPVNVDEARKWYEKAAEHGNKDAIGRIEGIARSNTLSRKDHEKAAIARIKSTYGSQRGKRPQRFQTHVQSMPSISDEPVDMPDPARPHSTSISNVNQPFLNPSIGRPPTARPTSTAPYPEDAPALAGPRPGTAAGFVRPDQRSSSAFGLNPNIRPSTTAPYPSGEYGAEMGASRPYSSIDNLSAGRGRGLAAGRVVSAAPGLNSYRQPNPPDAGFGRGGPEIQNGPPKLNIGYAAPLEASRPERRSRLQKSERPGDKPQLPTPNSPYDTPSDRTPRSRTPALPYSQSVPSGLRSSSQPMRDSNRTASADRNGRHDSVPNMPPGGYTSPMESSTPPLKKPPTQSSGKPETSQAAAKPPAASLPGKGPKTFEDMGIPAGKQENECTIM